MLFLCSFICALRLAKVFVNGDWIGFHENPTQLVNKLRHERRYNGGNVIPHETSIGWVTWSREIDIRTDAGRLTRPVMIVEDNKLKIQREDIERKDYRLNFIKKK